MPSLWTIEPAEPTRAQALARGAGIDHITAQLLLNRGVHTPSQAQRFFNPGLDGLEDPMLLPDMAKAVKRIRRAIEDGEPILVFGDSDVDGLTANVILYEVLRSLGAHVRARSANRIADGYGLPGALVRQLCRSSTKLLVMVDCGTNQAEAIRTLHAHGIDTIVIDHHVPMEGWAKPHALINPHRVDGPGHELCSAGLVFGVARALLDDDARQTAAYLDLAALGTLADCSPLRKDNRILVSVGLERLVHSERLGVRRLCEATGVTQPNPEQVVRRLVPRLNASGRLGDASAAWRLLCGEHEAQHDAWAAQVGAAHDATKQLQRQIVAQAHEQMNRLHFKDQYVLVVHRTGWHQGLMGPLAAQLSQQYGRPAIALAMDEAQGTGSGRSVPSFNLLETLKACQEMLVRFGGHAQACGLTIDRRHLDRFRDMVNQHAKVSLGADGLTPSRWADVELPLASIEPAWVDELEGFAPFGQGNPRPTVLIRGVRLAQRSPRSGVVSDGAVQLPVTGALPETLDGERYDVLASPLMTTRELRLILRGARASAAP